MAEQRHQLLSVAAAGLAGLTAGPLIERLIRFVFRRLKWSQLKRRCLRQFDVAFFSGGSLTPPCQAAGRALVSGAAAANAAAGDADAAAYCPSPSACQLSHSAGHPYFQLIRQLLVAECSLDVCMYTLSSPELANLLIALNRRKPKSVRVRIICDSEQLHSPGSAIAKLRSSGVPVRADSTSYFMHHKFCIIDSRLVLTGSLNWTAQGTLGNWENVVALDDADVVAKFSQEFKCLWNEFSH